MNTKLKIFYDPEAGNNGGGGAGASPASDGGSPSPSAASSAPAAPAKTETKPLSPMESMAIGLQDSLRKSKEAQPPGDGKKDESAATDPEGATETENEDTPATTTTEGDAPEDGKGGDNEKGWTEEEKAALKAHKWDGLPFSAESRNFLKSHQELRSQFDRVSASNSNVISRNQALEAALLSGDLKELSNMGFDLKVDQRTPDQMIGELEEQFASVKSTFEPVIQELAKTSPEAAQAVTMAARKLIESLNTKAEVIQREQDLQKRESEWAKKYGLKPDSKTSYEKMSDSAERNLTALVQKDPDATKYYAELKEATKPGGALHALGVNLAKAYGTSAEAAKFINEVGKGLYLAKNQKTILAEARKSWEKDYESRGTTRGTQGSRPKAAESSKASPLGSHLSAAMKSMMPAR